MRYAITIISIIGAASSIPITQGPGGGFTSIEIPGSKVNNAFAALEQIATRDAKAQGWRDPDRTKDVGNEKRQGWRDPDHRAAITNVLGANIPSQTVAREAAPQGPGGGFISIEIPPASQGCLLGMNCPGDPNYPGKKREAAAVTQGPGGGFISIEIPPASEGCLLGMNCPGDPNYTSKKLARSKDGWCPNGFCGTELPPPISADGCLLGLNCPGDAGWNGAPWKGKREAGLVAQGPGEEFTSTEITDSKVNNAMSALGQIVAKGKR